MPTGIRASCGRRKTLVWVYQCDTVTVWFRLQSGQHTVASWHCWKCMLWVLLLHLRWLINALSIIRCFHCFTGWVTSMKSRPDNRVFGAVLQPLPQPRVPLCPPTQLCDSLSQYQTVLCVRVLGFVVTAATAAHSWGSSHTESAGSTCHGCAPVNSPTGNSSKHTLGNMWKQVLWDLYIP